MAAPSMTLMQVNMVTGDVLRSGACAGTESPRASTPEVLAVDTWVGTESPRAGMPEVLVFIFLSLADNN